MALNHDVKLAKTGFWHMPKTFYAVLLIEFCERFAFYGLQSVAVVYFISQFSLKESTSSILFGSFSALLYGLLTVGGIIGDKVLGLRRTYILGIVFLTIGYGLLIYLPTINSLYFAMGVILVGNILFKTNANNYVSRCFESNDPRLDSAFTYFYASINLGGMFSLLLVPIVAQGVGYKIGLSLCNIAMVIAILVYVSFYDKLKNADNKCGKWLKNAGLKMLGISIAASICACVLGYMLSNVAVCSIILYTVSAIILLIYLVGARRLNHYEALGMYITLILLIQAAVFAMLYNQIGTSLTLFAYHNIDLTYFGYHIPAGSTQMLEAISIALLSPVLANIYIYRHKKCGQDFTIPNKFAIGLMSCGLSFIVLGVAIEFFTSKSGNLSLWWLVLAYFLYGLGELLVSAIGISMVSKLLPKRYGGFAQGVWFLSLALGMDLGGKLSGIVATHVSVAISATASINAYMQFFYSLGAIAVLIGVIFFMFTKRLNKSIELVLAHRG